MVGHVPIEVAKTVLEVADVAWTAVECCHHHRHPHPDSDHEPISSAPIHHENESGNLENLEALRSENQRLRNLLQGNLQLLRNISQSPFYQNCPPDLHARLLSAVSSINFLNQLESKCTEFDCEFPFKEASGSDVEAVEILIDVNDKDPSWWVWVTDEMASRHVEEKSGIDNENYVMVGEDHVVDAVANFMAKCVVSNTRAKDFTPKELQKAIIKALGGTNKVDKMVHIWHAGKMFYTLSTWGLALAGLYRSRAILRVAAMGVHATSKVVLKAV